MTDFDDVWRFPPRKLMLPSSDVHVWYVSLDQLTAQLEQLLKTLSVDERIRAERFHFEQDRKRFIIGRGILRTILGNYLNTNPSELQFCYGLRGKPALAEICGESTLRFNLSHSQGLALYAITRNRQLGIDIEYLRPIPQAEQIAKNYFSAREKAVFFALPQEQKQVAFFNCWTRKEAYLKAIGDGLAFPLNQLDVSLSPGEPAQLYSIKGDRSAATHWSLYELKLVSNYVAALAVEGHDWHLSCWQWH